MFFSILGLGWQEIVVIILAIFSKVLAFFLIFLGITYLIKKFKSSPQIENSIESRLKTLDQMLKNNKISQSEFQEQRNTVISEI